VNVDVDVDVDVLVVRRAGDEVVVVLRACVSGERLWRFAVSRTGVGAEGGQDRVEVLPQLHSAAGITAILKRASASAAGDARPDRRALTLAGRAFPSTFARSKPHSTPCGSTQTACSHLTKSRQNHHAVTFPKAWLAQRLLSVTYAVVLHL
jgi:hypothetical protein